MIKVRTFVVICLIAASKVLLLLPVGGTSCQSSCLLLSNTTNILIIHTDTSRVESLIPDLKGAVALDVDVARGYIYWSDVSEQVIRRAKVNGSSIEVLFRKDVGVCDGLAVDWRSGLLYWTDTTYDAIEVADVYSADKPRRVLFNLELDEPRGIAVEPNERYLFWTDWGNFPKIERSTLNGNGRTAIVSSVLGWPNDITIDHTAKKIFWVDSKLDRIETVDYNGNGRTKLFEYAGIHPFSVTYYNNLLYWSDWGTVQGFHSIHTSNNQIRSFTVMGNRPMGVTMFDQSIQPIGPDPCGNNNGGCSHLCLAKPGGNQCACATGIALSSDGKTCNKDFERFLMFTDASAKTMNMISLDVNYFARLTVFTHFGKQRPIAIDYDPVEDRVYWSDVEQHWIARAFKNGTSLEFLYNCDVHTPDGLAIDWIGRNVYWTDTGMDRIEVGKLDGSAKRSLITDGLDKPRDIVVNPSNGEMYWTDWGSGPRIEKANMDGSSRRTLVNSGLKWPNCLDIDRSANKLYWADGWEDKIEQSDLDGQNRKVILQAVNIHPFGVALYQGYIYWTDWKNKAVLRLNIVSGHKDTVVVGLSQPMDIHVCYPGMHTVPAVPNLCSSNNGGCSDICLVITGAYKCACPNGITLKADGKTCDYASYENKFSDRFMLVAAGNAKKIYRAQIPNPDHSCYFLPLKRNISRPVAITYDSDEDRVYWTDVILKIIARAFLNGTNIEVIADHGVFNPDGLAIDYISHNLYWTDAGSNKIEVSRLDGTSRRTLITNNLEEPKAIALDPLAGYMYWTDLGVTPKIERASMDGSSRSTIVDSDLGWPNGLVIDFQSRQLYWCDGKTGRVETSDLLGGNRRILLDVSGQGSFFLFDIALYRDAIYWSDRVNKAVYKYNMTSGNKTVQISGISKPMGVVVYDKSKQRVTGNNSCSQLNGGCSNLCLPVPNGRVCACPNATSLSSSDPTTCEGVIRCPKLTAPSKGTLSSCTYNPGSRCQFSCNYGYTLVGSQSRQCLPDGSWSGKIAKCHANSCPQLTAPYHGFIMSCMHTPGHNCNFSCNRGYTLVGSQSRVCLSNGTWTGTKSECRAIRCQPLDPSPNSPLMTANCSGSHYGARCNLSCSTGYEIRGNFSRECLAVNNQPLGVWSGTMPTCEAISCPPIPIPPRAVLKSWPCTNRYNHECILGCITGYKATKGNSARTCLQKGQWNGTNITCTDVLPPSFGVTCPRDKIVFAEHGIFSASVSWTKPTATDNSGILPNITCNIKSLPYRFNEGIHTIRYTAVDSIGNEANCSFRVIITVIRCQPLSIPSDSSLVVVSCPSMHYGALCNMTCSSGYVIRGTSSRECLAINNGPPGVWSGQMPSCEVVTCSALRIPQNGALTGCQGNQPQPYSTVCHLTCNLGYYQTGSPFRSCTENGSWSGKDTKCTAITCDSLTVWGYVHVSPNSCQSRPIPYGTACILSCPSGFTLYGTSTRTCGPRGSLSGDNNTHCQDTTRPTFDGRCPQDMLIYPDKCSQNAKVKWIEPRARDNSANVTMRYPSLRPPVNMSVGVYNMVYMAQDEAGNAANCSFAIQVKERRCALLQAPKDGTLVSLSCGNLYGSKAALKCHVGYIVSGAEERSCLQNRRWSGVPTSCKRVTCPSLPYLHNGVIKPETCTRDYPVAFGTHCVFMCDEQRGYKYVGPASTSCTLNGTWNPDPRNAECRDISAPSISCPPAISRPTDPHKSYATVEWDPPHPTDLSGGTPSLTVEPKDITHPYRFNFGVHTVVYTATDTAGLSSSCTFRVVITDTEQPRAVRCPSDFAIVSDKQGTRIYLPLAEFEDNVGIREVTTDLINGSEYSWGSYINNYTATDLAGNKAVCSVKITIKPNPCPYLDPPLNGAKSCETWLAGMYCTVHCNPGYKLLHREFKILYFCNPGGRWVNVAYGPGGKPKLPDCSRSYPPTMVVMSAELHYLMADCDEEGMEEEIKAYFVEIFSLHPFGKAGGCNANPSCIPENVQVECEDEGRRKRDLRLYRRSSQLKDVKVTFEIKFKLPRNVSENVNTTMRKLKGSLSNFVNESNLDMTIDGKVVPLDRTKPLKIGVVEIKCEKGQVAVDWDCVNCPVGYFYNTTGKSCDPCPANHYQKNEAQEICDTCPKGTTTSGLRGTRWLTECVALAGQGRGSKQKRTYVIALAVTVPAVFIVLLVAVCCYRHKRSTTSNQRGKDNSAQFNNPAYVVCDENLHELYDYQELVKPHIYQGLQNLKLVFADATTHRYGPGDDSTQQDPQEGTSDKLQNHVQIGDLSFETLSQIDEKDEPLYEVIPAVSKMGETNC